MEADEFDKAFLALAPTVAVINNVEADHLECYGGNVAELERAFVQFARGAALTIVGAEDPGAARVAAALETPVWRLETDCAPAFRAPDGQSAPRHNRRPLC